MIREMELTCLVCKGSSHSGSACPSLSVRMAQMKGVVRGTLTVVCAASGGAGKKLEERTGVKEGSVAVGARLDPAMVFQRLCIQLLCRHSVDETPATMKSRHSAFLGVATFEVQSPIQGLCDQWVSLFSGLGGASPGAPGGAGGAARDDRHLLNDMDKRWVVWMVESKVPHDLVMDVLNKCVLTTIGQLYPEAALMATLPEGVLLLDAVLQCALQDLSTCPPAEAVARFKSALDLLSPWVAHPVPEWGTHAIGSVLKAICALCCAPDSVMHEFVCAVSVWAASVTVQLASWEALVKVIPDPAVFFQSVLSPFSHLLPTRAEFA